MSNRYCDLSRSDAWQALRRCCARFLEGGVGLRGLFEAEASRVGDLSVGVDGLWVDCSKNLVDRETMQGLVGLARERGLGEAIEAMFRGEAVNDSEGRAALHVALRDLLDAVGAEGIGGASNTGGKGKAGKENGHGAEAAEADASIARQRGEVAEVLERMGKLVGDVHRGEWLGWTGKRFTDVVHIGIGGCDLGPAMVTEALADFHTGHVNCHFVSNVDPVLMESTLDGLSAEHTLFILASKSGTTPETWQNMLAARDWFLSYVAQGKQTGQEAKDNRSQQTREEDAVKRAINRHFILVTGRADAQAHYEKAGLALDEANIFPVWDWVGGRFSLWSAVGLPIALAVGMDNFRALLAGARRMDEHFRSAPFERNMPVMLGLLGVWYGSFMGAASYAVIPYAQRLRLMPAYLQQLAMESLGKRVDRGGVELIIDSGEVLWGTVGSNAQHSCFQLLHQGTRLIPVDFIAVAKPMTDSGKKDNGDQKNAAEKYRQQLADQHDYLLANCFSQSQALMQGDAHPDAPHRHLSGNRPSNTLLLETLDPFNLGMLLALYEHKVYVQSVIWGINAFDQWGVELGKRLAEDVHKSLTDTNGSQADPSTAALIDQVKHWQTQP